MTASSGDVLCGEKTASPPSWTNEQLLRDVTRSAMVGTDLQQQAFSFHEEWFVLEYRKTQQLSDTSSLTEVCVASDVSVASQ